jgi:hypothetical protein
MISPVVGAAVAEGDNPFENRSPVLEQAASINPAKPAKASLKALRPCHKVGRWIISERFLAQKTEILM